MSKNKQRSQSKDKFNGLSSDLATFGRFIFIYEKTIKHKNKLTDFESEFPISASIFKKFLQDNLSNAKVEEIKNLKFKDAKATLFYTKRTVQVIDFCRHLRNSFSHALLRKSNDLLYVIDKYRGNITSTGTIDYASTIEFIKSILKEHK